MTKNDMLNNCPICIKVGQENREYTIQQKDVTEAHVTLGVRMSPLGDEQAQAAYLKEKLYQIATAVASSNLNRKEAYVAYRACWAPAIGYSLGTTTLSQKQLEAIQTSATGSFLSKMGFNRHFLRSVVFGPSELGGIALCHIPTEQGIHQILYILEHVYNTTIAGQLIMMAVQYTQLEAGTKALILTDTNPDISYVTASWVTSVRDFLRNNQISLEFSESWNCNLSRQGDGFLMDIFRQSGQFSLLDLRHLNAIRLYLQVTTISDITSADGTAITKEAYSGNIQTDRQSKWSWPRQSKVTESQKRLWGKALRTHLLKSQNPRKDGTINYHLKDTLGKWINATNQWWRYYYDPKSHMLLKMMGEQIEGMHLQKTT